MVAGSVLARAPGSHRPGGRVPSFVAEEAAGWEQGAGAGALTRAGAGVAKLLRVYRRRPAVVYATRKAGTGAAWAA